MSESNDAQPWEIGPRKVQWVDEATDLDCLIIRQHHGALCGYVGVPNGHPLYGVGYYDDDPRLDAINVHGGLTYGATCNEDDPEGVCHVPEPGRPHDVFWHGFDCAHANDYVPAYAGREFRSRIWSDGEYRDHAYVRSECERLAAQLAAVR